MRYITGLINLIISLVVSTIIIYTINIIAGFVLKFEYFYTPGTIIIWMEDYSFTNGEVFVIWILMAILVNNCFKN